MARSLLKSPDIEQVTGYDLSVDLVQTFYDEARAANKAPPCLPGKLELAVDGTTDVVVIVLVNERQCESVCFGDGDSSLTTLLRDGACVVVSSTVSAAWAKSAEERLASRNVQFVDSPISGGAVRANRSANRFFRGDLSDSSRLNSIEHTSSFTTEAKYRSLLQDMTKVCRWLTPCFERWGRKYTS